MKKNKLIRGIILHVLSILVLIIPFLILMYVNRDTWFIEGADKISIGCIISLLFAILLVKNAFKSIDKRITTLIAMGVMLVVVWLFDSIIQDLYAIILCGMIGYALYCVLNTFAVKDINFFRTYNEIENKNAIKQDIEDNKNKVKLEEEADW